MKTSDKIQTAMVIVTAIAVIITLGLYFAELHAIQSQKKDELKTIAIALQLDVIRLKTGVEPLDNVMIRYANTNCDNPSLNLGYLPPNGLIYPPNGVFFAFQRDIAKLNITVASEIYAFYYNLQEAEFFREKWASNATDTTSESALINIGHSNKNRCLAAMQSDMLLGMLNQTIESL